MSVSDQRKAATKLTPCENKLSITIEVHGMWQGDLETSGHTRGQGNIWGTCAKPKLLARVSVTASISSFNV